MTAYPALKMLINGEWIASGEAGSMDVVNPATGLVIGHCPKASRSRKGKCQTVPARLLVLS